MGTSVVVIATAWGPQHGGINVFNVDFCCALAAEAKCEVVCAVPAVNPTAVSNAEKSGVRLIPFRRHIGENDGFLSSHDGNAIAEVLQKEGVIHVGWWIGHDIVTGFAALRAQAKTGSGKTVVIHHMDYRAYESMKNLDGPAAHEKEEQQKDILAAADLVCGVGPKLGSAAKDKLIKAGVGLKSGVLELQPGLYEVVGIDATDSFTAITFGRLDQRADVVKMGSLAAAAFGRAVRSQGLGRDPSLTVVGLDSKHESEECSRLVELVGREAERKLPIIGLPFADDRHRLLHHLREHSVALVLSIHEGFGLTAWEAISAEVPLILTRNSGAYMLIHRLLGGAGTGCLKGVDVKGLPASAEPNPEDVKIVAELLLELGRDKEARRVAKQDARRLKQMLSEHVSWKRMARAFAMHCGMKIRQSPIPLAVAGGNADANVCGSRSIPREQLDLPHKAASAIWDEVADGIGRILAQTADPCFQLNFPGVDGGNFGARVLRASLLVPGSKVEIKTFTHHEFSTEQQAKEMIPSRYPTHSLNHNVDSKAPHLFQPGSVVRLETMSLRRAYLVRQSDALLCVAGYFAVEEFILAALNKRIPIIAIGAFGGITAKKLDEITNHNFGLSISTSLKTALQALAQAPLDRDAILRAFTAVVEDLKATAVGR